MIIIIVKKGYYMKRYSRQRELILQSLKNRTDHPTAEKLYLDLKEQMPELGIATVYRNLSELCEEGDIIKIKSKKHGPDRFDGNIMPHIHFECNSCQELFDIFLYDNQIEKLNNEIKKIASGVCAELTESTIQISGFCIKCKNKIKKEN